MFVCACGQIRAKYEEYVRLWEERLTTETQRLEQAVVKAPNILSALFFIFSLAVSVYFF